MLTRYIWPSWHPAKRRLSDGLTHTVLTGAGKYKVKRERAFDEEEPDSIQALISHILHERVKDT